MGVIRRQAISNSIISYLGILLGYLNVAVLFPRLLGDELFGFTQVLVAAMTLFANFGSLGIRNVALRFFPIFKDNYSERNNPFLSVLALTTFLGSIVSLLLLLLFEDEVVNYYTDRAPLIARYVDVLLFLTPVGILGITLDSYSQSLHRTAVTAFFKEVVVRLLNLAAVLFFFYGMISEPSFVWLFAIVQGVYAILMLMYLHRFRPIRFRGSVRSIPKAKMLDMSKYGAISLFSSTLGMSGNIQVLLIGSLVGLKSAAIFGVASAIGKVLNVTGRSVNRIASAVVSDAWASNDLRKIDRIYAKSARTNLVFAGLIFVCIMVNLDSLFVILPKGYRAGEAVLIFLMVSKVINLATGMNAGIIQQSKRYRMNLLFNLLTLALIVGLSVWLIPIYDITGVGIADLITVSSVNLIRFWYLKSEFKMQPFDHQTLFIGLLISSMSIAGYSLEPFFSWWVDIPMRVMTFGLIYAAIIYQANWSADFTEAVDLGTKKIRRYIGKSQP